MVKKKETKEDKYVTIYSPIGLVSYPFLHAPYVNPKKPNDKAKFSVEIYVEKERFIKEAKEFVAGILKVAKRYNPEWTTLADFKSPICDCDKEIKKADMKPYQKGMIRIRAGTQVDYPPTIIGPQKIDGEFPVWTAEQIKTIKGGDYGRIIGNPYGWSVSGNTGISIGMNFFQFARIGKAIGEGRMKAIESLDEIEVPVDSPDEMIDTDTDSDDTKAEEVDPMLSFA